jgi:hypothetical protein
VLGVGILPADGETAVPFDVAEDAPWDADVLAVVFAGPGLETGGKLQARITRISATGRGDEEIFTAGRGPGKQDKQSARFRFCRYAAGQIGHLSDPCACLVLRH